jgi:diaminopropionate ammonia-lyase
MALVSALGLRHQPNAHARTGTIGPRQRAVLSPERFAAAKAEIASWPGYAPTPLFALDGLAAAAGLHSLWYKHEAGRFGIGSFKALGGAYAVCRLLKVELARQGIEASTADLVARKHADAVAAITVTCATDGNHGRSVAWGARMFGCACVIYIHKTVSVGRADAIAAFGAKVLRIDGNYDEAVRQAAVDAAANHWFVVSDTSYPGYMEVPRDVMQGYTVMAAEAFAQLPAGEIPTHIFLQGGVGGMAAAVAAQAWETWGASRPRIAVVEPETAACLSESAAAGHPVAVPGDLDTVMAGLACGEVSLLAWEILDEVADDFLIIPDSAAVAVMKLLAAGAGGDKPFVAGESAVAGLAGALAAEDAPEIAAKLGLDPNSKVLIFGSEGATDPETYAQLVGRTPEEVEA